MPLSTNVVDAGSWALALGIVDTATAPAAAAMSKPSASAIHRFVRLD